VTAIATTFAGSTKLRDTLLGYGKVIVVYGNSAQKSTPRPRRRLSQGIRNPAEIGWHIHYRPRRFLCGLSAGTIPSHVSVGSRQVLPRPNLRTCDLSQFCEVAIWGRGFGVRGLGIRRFGARNSEEGSLTSVQVEHILRITRHTEASRLMPSPRRSQDTCPVPSSWPTRTGRTVQGSRTRQCPQRYAGEVLHARRFAQSAAA
jgi:hypothetical protein